MTRVFPWGLCASVGTCGLLRDFASFWHTRSVTTLGLCHFPHNGFQNLMWTGHAAKGHVVTTFDVWLIHYLWATEPEFTFADAKNSWRFIVDQLPELLVFR